MTFLKLNKENILVEKYFDDMIFALTLEDDNNIPSKWKVSRS